MKEFFGVLVVCVVVLFVVMVIGYGVGWWGLWFQRSSMPYVEETRRITYGQSLAYQQGAQRDFETLCLQYQTASDDASKSIIRDMIQRRKRDYVGPALDGDVLSCFNRLGIQ